MMQMSAVVPSYGKGLDEAVKELTWGLAFKKHAYGSDSVDSRDLFLRKLDSSVTLHWGPIGKRATDTSRTIALGDVTELAWGKQTATFEKKSAAKADERRCVSVTTKKRSLDCELDTEEHAILIVSAVGGLLQRNGVKFAYKSKLQPPTGSSASPASAASAAKLERIDTQSDLSDAKSAPQTAATAAAAAPTATATATATAVVATSAPAVPAAAGGAAGAAEDPDEAMRAKFFADVNAAGKANGIEYFVIVSKPNAPTGGVGGSGGDAKCYHSTSRAIAPREFAHLDNAVRTSTLLLNLTETAPNPADVATKQRLAQCKDEIESVKKQLAETMSAIAALETPDTTEAATAASASASASSATAAAAVDSKS